MWEYRIEEDDDDCECDCYGCEECDEDEDTTTFYDFAYVNQFGLHSHMCKEKLLFEPEAELPLLLNAFKQFAHCCGFDYINEIKAVVGSEEEISSEY